MGLVEVRRAVFHGDVRHGNDVPTYRPLPVEDAQALEKPLELG